MDQSILPSLGLIALLVAMGITLYDLRVSLQPSTCSECGHCQALARSAAIEQERLSREYARSVGLAEDEDDDRRIE